MKIAVINTGGTISCVGNPLAPMTAEAFANACKELLDPILQQQTDAILKNLFASTKTQAPAASIAESADAT